MRDYKWTNINGQTEENYSMNFHPDMQDSEICLIKGIMVALSKKMEKINIFEWGSGKSTIYFSGFLYSQQIPFSWHSGEHNRFWYNRLHKLYFNKVFKQLAPHVNIHLAEIKGYKDFRKVPNTLKEKYINLPKQTGLKFDIMMVDGRYRRLCVLNSKKYLSNNGILILMEAERKHYHCALSEFEFQTFLDIGYTWHNMKKKVWIGSNDEENFNYVVNYISDFNNLLPLGRNAFYWPAAHFLKKMTPKHKPYSLSKKGRLVNEFKSRVNLIMDKIEDNKS
ncbi:MAG: hypothetical protein ACXAC5_09975 [Promethearchaeota archaeon]|jgi:hypothetical protein